jgi:hypothetical protein
MEQENKHLWDQFCKLGEMMGDGLHHEPDGKWISREYKKLSKILVPEIKEVEQKRRIQKNGLVDQQINNLLADKKCSCGGSLRQSRSGSKILYCTVCPLRYKATSKNK